MATPEVIPWLALLATEVEAARHFRVYRIGKIRIDDDRDWPKGEGYNHPSFSVLEPAEVRDLVFDTEQELQDWLLTYLAHSRAQLTIGPPHEHTTCRRVGTAGDHSVARVAGTYALPGRLWVHDDHASTLRSPSFVMFDENTKRDPTFDTEEELQRAVIKHLTITSSNHQR